MGAYLAFYVLHINNNNNNNNIRITTAVCQYRFHPDDEIYKTPVYFSSDWLNEYCTDHSIDDYKFVYIGAKGTW